MKYPVRGPVNPYRVLNYNARILGLAAKDGVDTRSRPAVDAWYAEKRKEGPL